MLIKIKGSWELKENQITSLKDYISRRGFIKNAGIMGAASAASLMSSNLALAEESLSTVSNLYDGHDIMDEKTDIKAVRGYNNYYEFGTGKGDPAANAHRLSTNGWSIVVDGMVDNPGRYSLPDLLTGLTPGVNPVERSGKE